MLGTIRVDEKKAGDGGIREMMLRWDCWHPRRLDQVVISKWGCANNKNCSSVFPMPEEERYVGTSELNFWLVSFVDLVPSSLGP